MVGRCKAVQKAVGEGFDRYKRKKGSSDYLTADTLGHLLAVLVTPANEQERAQVGGLAQQVQEATQHSVKLAEAKRGIVLLPLR